MMPSSADVRLSGAWLAMLRSVDAEEPDAGAVDLDRVAVDNPWCARKVERACFRRMEQRA